jgi:hypothetical protein
MLMFLLFWNLFGGIMMVPNASKRQQRKTSDISHWSSVSAKRRVSKDFRARNDWGTIWKFISVFTYPSWPCWICDCHFQVAMTSNRLDIMMISSYCVSIRMVFRIWGTFHLFPGIKSVLHPRPRHMISGKARWSNGWSLEIRLSNPKIDGTVGNL